MLKIGSAESDLVNIPKTLEDNLVDAQIVNKRGMLSHEIPEAGVAEILAILTDSPAEASVEAFGLREIDTQSTKWWTPNPEGIGLDKISRTKGGRNSNDTLEFTERQNSPRTSHR